jgi:hypothetical protein
MRFMILINNERLKFKSQVQFCSSSSRLTLLVKIPQSAPNIAGSRLRTPVGSGSGDKIFELPFVLRSSCGEIFGAGRQDLGSN